MKYNTTNILLSGLTALLFISGCVTEPKYPDDKSLHWVKFSMKEGVPCFAIREDSTISQSTAKISTVSVSQITKSNDDMSFSWMIRWQEPVRLSQNECIQYGTDAGRKTFVYPEENCTNPNMKPVHGGYKLLPSGECVGDDEAQKLEKGITYFIDMNAQTDDSREDKGHYIRDFFCLTDGNNGETIVRRLIFDQQKRTVQTCPGTK